MWKSFFFLAAGVLFYSHLSAQETKPKISGSFQNIRAPKFFRQLEAQTPYRFYFDSVQVATININITAQDEALEKVLERAFQKTDLKYSLDKDGHVFITTRYHVIPRLAAGYYKDGKANGVNEDEIADFTEKTSKPETKVSEQVYTVGEKRVRIRPTAIVSGTVKNTKTGEPVTNASVFIEKLQRGTVTDQYGNYSFTIPTGEHVLSVQSLGMQDVRYKVNVYSDGGLNIELKEAVATLREVVVSSQKVANVTRVQLGLEKLSIATIKKVPALFGEADVIKAVLTLPGVKSVGEASAGFNVRGGSTDQNLILLNDGTIYNPSHFFGMFSAFNPEIIKDVELYKSSIPVKYGGRLSSVLNISTREGSKRTFTGLAGIGVITSRFNIEGPIKKDKTSFILGGRTTYANWLLKLLPDPYDRSKAAFADINLGVHHQFSQKSDLYVTGYFSTDKFNLASDTTYGYRNKSANIKWKNAFSSQVTGYFTAGFDQYDYQVKSLKNKVNAYNLGFDVTQYTFKADFVHLINAKHTLDYGINSIYYKLNPGSFTAAGKESLVANDIIPSEQALESAIYLGDRFNITNNLSLVAGIRYSIFNYMGPQDVRTYTDGLPRSEATLIGTEKKDGMIQTYSGPEYRVSLRYAFNNTFSVKAGYNTTRQYIHMLSNTTSIAPTDIWKLSDPNIRPQEGDQVSLGFYKNLKSNTIELSAEVYYKQLKNYLDYKPGAKLVLNHHIETDVVNAKGKAYGFELMAKKPGGKLNGWISYTYSRILLKMDDPTVSELVNRGEYYPANYDKPHDVTMVGNFRVNHRFSFSWNVTYSTGRPITLPIGRFYYAGAERVLYSDRNAYRIPDYFRMDLAVNIDGNHKVKQKTHNSWTFGFYNLTARKNPYSVYFTTENGLVQGYKLSILGSILPFINYNIRF
jgi:hypothetical protein